MKEIILFGTGGHAKVVADILKCNNGIIEGCLCNDGNQSIDLPILGDDDAAENEFSDKQFIICVGNNEIRKKISLAHPNLSFAKAIHPSAIIASDAIIGKGTVVMAGAIINPGVIIGDHCIINSGSIIEHDCEIGNYSHVSPGAKLGGTVKVGENVHIGIGATVKNNINICNNVVVGAGTVVVKNIDDDGTYIGIPARKMI